MIPARSGGQSTVNSWWSVEERLDFDASGSQLMGKMGFPHDQRGGWRSATSRGYRRVASHSGQRSAQIPGNSADSLGRSRKSADIYWL